MGAPRDYGAERGAVLCGKIMVRNEMGGGIVRLRCGTGWEEVMCDYGAEPYVVPGSKIMVRTVRWMSVWFRDLLTA